MTEKEILSFIHLTLDQDLAVKGFKFDKKRSAYLKFDEHSDLYFEISLLCMDIVVAGTNYKSKYLEIFANIYNKEISTKIWKSTTRGNHLNSYFYFKIVGNMFSDILLNPRWCEYNKRNNHNYFKLEYVSPTDLEIKTIELRKILFANVIPFFEELDNIDKIRIAIDCSYKNGISIHNVNTERLFALIVLLKKANDTNLRSKIFDIKTYFKEVNNTQALTELDQLLVSLDIPKM